MLHVPIPPSIRPSLLPIGEAHRVQSSLPRAHASLKGEPAVLKPASERRHRKRALSLFFGCVTGGDKLNKVRRQFFLPPSSESHSSPGGRRTALDNSRIPCDEEEQELRGQHRTRPRAPRRRPAARLSRRWVG